MKVKYISPETTTIDIHPYTSLLSSSINPDVAAVSWQDAQEDTQGVEINVKRNSYVDWATW